MIIVKIIAIWLVAQVAFGTILWSIVDWKKEREKKAFANQPTEVLKNFMLMDIECSTFYWNMRRVMSEEKATDNAINHYLIKNGLIGYRDDDEDEG